MNRLAWAIFTAAGTVKFYGIERSTFEGFSSEASRLYSYRNNAYHNYKHGITVLQHVFCFIETAPIKERGFFSELGKAAILFAAYIHDIDHSGKSNFFEINSISKLAIRYNDSSVLESHHISRGFQILQKEATNIFSNLEYSDFIKFRKYVITSVLATDVKFHFRIVEKLKEAQGSPDFYPLESASTDDFLLLLEALTHTADLYVPTLEHKVSLKWSDMVVKEFKAQALEEERRGLPLTPYYQGLDNPKAVAKSEISFINSIVRPLWMELDGILQGSLQKKITNLNRSLEHWEHVLNGTNKALE